MTKYIQLYST